VPAASLGPITSIFGISTTGVGGALLRVLGSIALQTALTPKPKSIVPEALPFKRFVYGDAVAQGTPIPWPAKNGYAYAAWLMNSRESHAVDTIYLNNQALTLTGDATDFSGDGATATNGLFADHVNVFIGKGDQTAPPTMFTDDAAYDASTFPWGWKTTDAGEGTTIIFARLKRGGSGDFADRWDNRQIIDCKARGRWSKIWDLRVEGQNATLCAIDAFIRNPSQPIAVDDLDIDLLKQVATICAEDVALKAGGTEERYPVSGTVTFDGSELAQIMQPFADAMAGEIVRNGGKIGLMPGVAQDAALTVSEMVSGPTFKKVQKPSELYHEVRTKYFPQALLTEPAELPPYAIPGVTQPASPKPLEVFLPLVASDAQAQRIGKIRGINSRRLKSTTFVGWPETAKLIKGARFDLSRAAPLDTLNGPFVVESMQPGAALLGDDDGMALRNSITGLEYIADAYAWDETTEEITITHTTYQSPSANALETPTITSTSSTSSTVSMTAQAPNDSEVQSMELRIGTTSDPTAATDFPNSPFAVAATQSQSSTETGLTSETTYHVFARVSGPSRPTSDWATTTIDTTV